MTHRSHGHRRNAGAARRGFATLRYTQAIAALALALIALIANAADAERDPVEGFWLGTTGPTRKRSTSASNSIVMQPASSASS